MSINPSAERNKGPILEVLKKYLKSDEPQSLLEISSGTGQHVGYFAPNFPNITFQPSEFDENMIGNIQTYVDNCPTKNIRNALVVDVTQPMKTWGLNQNQFDYMLNINMIHITPFICTESLFRNAGILLKPAGLLITYGPYGNHGVIEPESNVRFDRMLQKQNASWGVRDVTLLQSVAECNGIELAEIHDMPANNKCLIWKKISK